MSDMRASLYKNVVMHMRTTLLIHPRAITTCVSPSRLQLWQCAMHKLRINIMSYCYRLWLRGKLPIGMDVPVTMRDACRLRVHCGFVVDGIRLVVDGQVVPRLLLPARVSSSRRQQAYVLQWRTWANSHNFVWSSDLKWYFLKLCALWCITRG